jgi:hypothetical protein
MIPFKTNPAILWNSISVNELDAIAHYQKFKGNIKFHASDHPHLPEDKVMFSRAISKFQHLVIFENE